MHEDLVRTIRKQCSDMDCGNCNTCVKLQAADAIEEMQEIIKKQHDLIMAFGGETGIQRLKEYADRYWTLLEKHRWIPVTETLPKTNKSVIVTDGETTGMGWIDFYDRKDHSGIEKDWYAPNTTVVEENITHWKPLPEPPEKGMKTKNDL